MFHDIPDEVIARMRVLEVLDAEQRQLNVATHERLCAVPPETGRFLAILAAAAPRGEMIEIGTSGGYSTLWLTRAALVRKQRVQSFEIAPAKLAIARDTFAKAGRDRPCPDYTGRCSRVPGGSWGRRILLYGPRKDAISGML